MLGVAVISFTALVLLMVRTRTGARYDHDMEWALGGPPWLFYNIERQLLQISVATTGIAGLLLAGVAVCRRRLGLALGILVLVGGATISTQILKYRVVHELPGNVVNSMPSGHATVGISISLALLLALPAAWQRFVLPVSAAVGFFFGAGTVIGHWHHPGDVLGALAVCLAWSALGLATAVLVDRRIGTNSRPRTMPISLTRSQTGWPVVAGIAVVSLLFLWWGARPSTGGARDLMLGLVAVGAIAAGTLLVYVWVARVAQRALS